MKIPGINECRSRFSAYEPCLDCGADRGESCRLAPTFRIDTKDPLVFNPNDKDVLMASGIIAYGTWRAQRDKEHAEAVEQLTAMVNEAIQNARLHGFEVPIPKDTTPGVMSSVLTALTKAGWEAHLVDNQRDGGPYFRIEGPR